LLFDNFGFNLDFVVVGVVIGVTVVVAEDGAVVRIEHDHFARRF
jgi:hypothetical protein